jgi:hypothetical protein
LLGVFQAKILVKTPCRRCCCCCCCCCRYNHMPSNADLVFIEYSSNGCTRLQCTSIISPLVSECVV